MRWACGRAARPARWVWPLPPAAAAALHGPAAHLRSKHSRSHRAPSTPLGPQEDAPLDSSEAVPGTPPLPSDGVLPPWERQPGVTPGECRSMEWAGSQWWRCSCCKARLAWTRCRSQGCLPSQLPHLQSATAWTACGRRLALTRHARASRSWQMRCASCRRRRLSACAGLRSGPTKVLCCPLPAPQRLLPWCVWAPWRAHPMRRR